MEYKTHKEWWLNCTEDGNLYNKLHQLRGGRRCTERAFWIDGSCPKCGHSAPGIYRPDLLENPYSYVCQRRNNPHGLMIINGVQREPCFYEGDVVVDELGANKIRNIMKLEIEKLQIIQRLINIDSQLEPYTETIRQPEFYFGESK